jgi:hypothetical protein
MSARCRKATDSERLKLMAIKATRGAAIYIAGGSITLDVPNDRRAKWTFIREQPLVTDKE